MRTCGASSSSQPAGNPRGIRNETSIGKKTLGPGFTVHGQNHTASFLHDGVAGDFKDGGLFTQGHRFASIGGRAFSLEIFMGPLLDMKGLEKNHYKQWTLWSGMAYGLLIICMAFFNIREQFQAIVHLVIVVAFVASTQDLAISALYIKLLNYEQRGIGSSSKVFALNLACIAGSGLLLIQYNHMGWRATLLTMGAIILLALVSLCFLEENKRDDSVLRHKIP